MFKNIKQEININAILESTFWHINVPYLIKLDIFFF